MQATAPTKKPKRKKQARFNIQPKPVRLEPSVEDLLDQTVKIAGRRESDVLRTAISEFCGKYKTKEEIVAAIERHNATFAALAS